MIGKLYLELFLFETPFWVTEEMNKEKISSEEAYIMLESRIVDLFNEKVSTSLREHYQSIFVRRKLRKIFSMKNSEVSIDTLTIFQRFL